MSEINTDKATKMMLSSTVVDIAENENYLELLNRVCYYNYPNGKMRQVNFGSTEDEQAATLEKAQTLVHMPVKAKYAKNGKGEPTFKGHEAKKDAKGNWVFGTEKIGTHENVYIEEADVIAADNTVQHLPCLYSKQRVWKDNKNVVAAIRRLYAEGRLQSSWELDVYRYEHKDGIKFLFDYAFIGNVYLGYEYAEPAFGQSAQVISVAAQGDEDDLTSNSDIIATALALDIAEREQSEVNELKDKDKNPATHPEVPAEIEPNSNAADTAQSAVAPATTVEADGVKENDVSGNAVEGESTDLSSMLTAGDLHKKIASAFRAVSDENERYDWYVAYLFPADGVAWFKKYNASELDYLEVKYAVADGNVTIESQTPITLVGTPKDMSAMLVAKSGEIAQLREKADAYDKAEAEHKQTKYVADVASLRRLVANAGCFTDVEVASLNDKIVGLETNAIKVMIADKLFGDKTAAPDTASQKHDTASLQPKGNLEEDACLDPHDTMSRFLGRQ